MKNFLISLLALLVIASFASFSNLDQIQAWAQSASVIESFDSGFRISNGEAVGRFLLSLSVVLGFSILAGLIDTMKTRKLRVSL